VENCYFDGSFQRKGKIGACADDVTQNYAQSLWVRFYVNAMYTFALGLNDAKTKHCSPVRLRFTWKLKLTPLCRV
jgi:hypothetical protein